MISELDKRRLLLAIEKYWLLKNAKPYIPPLDLSKINETTEIKVILDESNEIPTTSFIIFVISDVVKSHGTLPTNTLLLIFNLNGNDLLRLLLFLLLLYDVCNFNMVFLKLIFELKL